MIYALIITHSRGLDVRLCGRTWKSAEEARFAYHQSQWSGAMAGRVYTWEIVALDEPPATEAVMALLNGE